MHITLYFAVIRFHNPTLDYKSYSKYITKDFHTKIKHVCKFIIIYNNTILINHQRINHHLA